MKAEREEQSDDLLAYFERLVRVFTPFVKYEVWYLLGKLSIYRYPNTVVDRSRRKCRLQQSWEPLQ